MFFYWCSSRPCHSTYTSRRCSRRRSHCAAGPRLLSAPFATETYGRPLYLVSTGQSQPIHTNQPPPPTTTVYPAQAWQAPPASKSGMKSVTPNPRTTSLAAEPDAAPLRSRRRSMDAGKWEAEMDDQQQEPQRRASSEEVWEEWPEIYGRPDPAYNIIVGSSARSDPPPNYIP
ncbi:hypothetical protein HDU96_005733 [Phlyctochytrium bullatum]|nr:hypothetical protein HDU96_005733 [Phlyctochytrium bullatum]